MAKNITPRLADDIRASLHEALDYAAGKGTKAVVHRVVPHDTDAREARLFDGFSFNQDSDAVENYQERSNLMDDGRGGRPEVTESGSQDSHKDHSSHCCDRGMARAFLFWRS